MALVEENDFYPSIAQEVNQGRKERRYAVNARAKMTETELLLRDISLSGGRISSDDFLDIVPSGKYTIAIIPEMESKIGQFEVEILSKWVRMKKHGSESGFIMVVPAGGQLVEEYINFLKNKLERR
jgi:hypothetical protein